VSNKYQNRGTFLLTGAQRRVELGT
jgi:hypothetical protein